MRFLHGQPPHDLTYSDVFLVPGPSSVGSRLGVDLSPHDPTGVTIPVISANMNAVTGPRLAAAMARRGGLGVLPQDLPHDDVLTAVAWVKRQPVRFASTFLLPADVTVEQAKRVLPPAKGQGFVVMRDDEFVGWLPATVLARALDDALVGDLVHGEQPVLQAAEFSDDEALFNELDARRLEAAVMMDGERVLGTVSPKQVMRNTVFAPNVDSAGRLRVAAAIGINGDAVGRAVELAHAGVDVLVVDTAHGHQHQMADVLRAVREALPSAVIAAGNVVTADGVADLTGAGANVIKVGVGPGAMCTTRMMTGVGRPQFSAVAETAAEANRLGVSVWADGGIRYPRDVALALAAGGHSVMIGTWLAGTIESPGEIEGDAEGHLYKVNYGMASARAVSGRFARLTPLQRARKGLFSEGISDSKQFLDPLAPSVEDILDQITAGVRSAATYAGAGDLAQFHERATIGIQSAAGYEEGRALPQSW